MTKLEYTFVTTPIKMCNSESAHKATREKKPNHCMESSPRKPAPHFPAGTWVGLQPAPRTRDSRVHNILIANKSFKFLCSVYFYFTH